MTEKQEKRERSVGLDVWGTPPKLIRRVSNFTQRTGTIGKPQSGTMPQQWLRRIGWAKRHAAKQEESEKRVGGRKNTQSVANLARRHSHLFRHRCSLFVRHLWPLNFHDKRAPLLICQHSCRSACQKISFRCSTYYFLCDLPWCKPNSLIKLNGTDLSLRIAPDTVKKKNNNRINRSLID